MRKHLFSSMLAATGILLLASCSSDELETNQLGNDTQMTFVINLDNGIGASTRAISDGTQANKLVYAVYNEKGELVENAINSATNGQGINENAFSDGLTDNVSLTLAKGQQYTIAFWTQNKECTAYDTGDLKNVTISYDGKNNDEPRDAFFCAKTFTVTGSQTINVSLKRPFAQINVGVTQQDWNAAVASGIEVKQSKVVVKNAATSINLRTGATNGSQEVTYSLADIPAENLMVDADNDGTKEAYKWLSMSYILVADESEDGTTSEWVVTQAPTDDDAGTFTAIKYIADGYHEYNYGLPALKDEEGNLTEGYTAEADGKYSFEFKRGKVTFVPGQTPEVTATLGENSLAGFAGDVQSLSRHMGDVLSADDFAVPADKPDRVIGTVRVYDTAGHYVGTAEPGVWTFPAYDVVLEVASLTRVGYTQYDCGNEQSNRLPQPVYGGAIKANFTYSAAFGTLIHGSEAGDEMYGSVLSYAGTLTPRGAPLPTEDEPEPAEADTQFRMATHIGATDSDKPVVLGKTHSFVYNFENFGESRIYLRLNQVNASNTVEDGDAGVVIDLDPGESVTVQIDIEFANGSANRNVMALFTVLDDITDMKLGIAFAAKIAK